MEVILDGSANQDAISLPSPSKEITTSQSTGLYAFDSEAMNTKAVSAMVMMAGTDAANETFLYRLDGIVRAKNSGAGCYVYVPIARGTATLGTATYGSEGTSLGATGNLWADTINDTLMSERAAIFSPGNNEIARMSVDVTGLVGLRVQTRAVGAVNAATADVLCQLDDKLVPKIVYNRPLEQVAGATVTSSDTVTGTRTATLTATTTESGTKTTTATESGTQTVTHTADTHTATVTHTADTATTTLTESGTQTVTHTADTATITATATESGTGTKSRSVTMTVTGTGEQPTWTDTDTQTTTHTADTDTLTSTATESGTGTVTHTADTATVTATESGTLTTTATESGTGTVTHTADTDTGTTTHTAATDSGTLTMTAEG